MTGYDISDFMGRSCRFLQWPNGGQTRSSHPSNEEPRRQIHQAIASNSECQTSLVNYRKSGEMFVNFLTMVPITWDDPSQVRYWVGFQVDISHPEGLYKKGSQDAATNSVDAIKRTASIPFSPHPPVSGRLKEIFGDAWEGGEGSEREQMCELIANNLDGKFLCCVIRSSLAACLLLDSSDTITAFYVVPVHVTNDTPILSLLS